MSFRGLPLTLGIERWQIKDGAGADKYSHKTMHRASLLTSMLLYEALLPWKMMQQAIRTGEAATIHRMWHYRTSSPHPRA